MDCILGVQVERVEDSRLFESKSDSSSEVAEEKRTVVAQDSEEQVITCTIYCRSVFLNVVISN